MNNFAKLLDVFRQARWFTADRATAYAKIFLACYLPTLLVVGLLVSGRRLQGGQRVTTDFAAYWTGGRLALQRGVASAYDMGAQHQFQLAHFGVSDLFVPFYYPPPFLLVAAPLGALPFTAAFLVFVVASYLAYFGTASRLLPRGRWPIAAYPAALLNAVNGQTAALIAALFVGACQLLQRRPFVGGLVFGIIVIKPQFGLLIPIAFIAGRLWRAFAGAAVSAAGLTVASLAALGPQGVTNFLAAARTPTVILDDVGVILWKMQSLYAAARMLGAPTWAALGLQGVMSLGVAVLVWTVWSRPVDVMAKCAVLAVCALMATPYVFDYDLVLLILPICWLAGQGMKTGFLPWERVILAGGYLLAFVARPIAHATHLVIGPVVLALMLWAILRRLERRDAGEGLKPAPSP